MDHKLTLKLDNHVIQRAKEYARKKNTSLSKLIESYLELLTTSGKSNAEEITPLVKSLSRGDVSTKTDHKKEYRKHITKKYSN